MELSDVDILLYPVTFSEDSCFYIATIEYQLRS